MTRYAIVLTSLVASAGSLAQEPAVRLYAAGSLRAAMTDLAQSYRAAGGPEVTATFGASGLLRERIEKGEAPEVFASADAGNAQRLADAHRSGAPVVFARNQLCVLVGPGVDPRPGRAGAARVRARRRALNAGPGRFSPSLLEIQ